MINRIIKNSNKADANQSYKENDSQALTTAKTSPSYYGGIELWIGMEFT
tara:strand:+ start:99 stop:245 length:147 start_codon:yes stop_codon:yes gene_type:complete